MPKPTLIHDLEALCQKHGIASAVLVIPQPDDEFVVITRAISPHMLYSFGRKLVDHAQLDPSKLN